MPSTAIKPGHHRVLPWMATEALVRGHEAALGKLTTVYLGPTHGIALHPAAPSYVGFRAAHNDNGYLVRPWRVAPTVEALRARFTAFEAWLPSVARLSSEELAVIRWLRTALPLPLLGGR